MLELARQIVERQLERPLDQTADRESKGVGIDLRHGRVIPNEEQLFRGDRRVDQRGQQRSTVERRSVPHDEIGVFGRTDPFH
jgi:hypothetical protein